MVKMMSASAKPEEALGAVEVNGTVYLVYRLPVGPNARNLGIRHNFGLQGPRRSVFMVVDHGPKHALRSVSVGRSSAPRPLAGLTREHMKPFGVEVL